MSVHTCVHVFGQGRPGWGGAGSYCHTWNQSTVVFLTQRLNVRKMSLRCGRYGGVGEEGDNARTTQSATAQDRRGAHWLSPAEPADRPRRRTAQRRAITAIVRLHLKCTSDKLILKALLLFGAWTAPDTQA